MLSVNISNWSLIQLVSQRPRWRVSPNQLRPSVLLEALRHLQLVGLAASMPIKAGEDLLQRRYWRAPTFDR